MLERRQASELTGCVLVKGTDLKELIAVIQAARGPMRFYGALPCPPLALLNFYH